MLSLPRFLALVVIAAAAVNGLVGGGAAAQAGQVAHAAADEPSLRVGVRADDPLAPEVLLTNTGNTPCQVAATTLGTLSITLLEQGGTVVDPTYFDAAFTDGLDLAVQRRLQTLAPGATLTLAIPVRPIGPTGHALETVAAAASGPIGAFYPLNSGQALRLQVGYAVPVPVEAATPVCQVAPAAASARPAAPGDGGAGGPAWLRWALIAVAVVIALLVLLTLLRMLMHRGSGKAGTAAKPQRTPDSKSGESAKPGDAGKPADSAKPGEAATAEAPASTEAVPGTPDATTTGPDSASGTGPGAGLVVLALAAAMLVGYDWNTAARAEIAVDPSLASAWDSCSATLHGPDGDPAGILPALEAPGVTVSIIPANGDETHEGAISSTQIIVFWDPEDRHAYQGSGGNADPCTSLYHELYHAWEDSRGGQDRSPCVTEAGPSGLPVNEVNATRAQNQLRGSLGLPERSHYGPTPLPTGDCRPPDQQPSPPEPCPAGERCADSNGDPHLSTFDGVRYDFQAVGEFLAVVDPSGGLEIQVRQAPWADSRRVAVNTAVAMSVAGDRVQVTATPSGPTLLVGGKAAKLESASLPAGGSIAAGTQELGRTVQVRWPDGSTVTARPIGTWGLHLTFDVAKARANRLEGLFGDFDGDPSDDIRPRDGEPLVKPTFAQLYPAFADSWRITAATSLFTYEPGTSTETFTDRSFPGQEATAAGVPNRAAVEALCRRLGVTESVMLDACVVDVGLTGQPDFATALAATQVITAGGLDGSETLLRVEHPGGKATLTFNGQAGQAVFIDVPVTTLPNECSPLKLLDPTGKQVASGCLISSRGSIDRTALTSTGQYTVSLEPQEGVGAAWVKVVTAVDHIGPIVPDGPGVKVSLPTAGSQAQLGFDGVAGQAVFVDVPSSSMESQCSPLRILGPDGRQLTSGCIISHRGYIERTELPTTGRYTVVVDPVSRAIGEAVVRMNLTADQVGAVSVNGANVVANLPKPGSVASFTFTGTAGQIIRVDAPTSSLVSQCSPLRLVGPDGRRLTSGCIISGEGSIDAVVLPQSGLYTLVVDPVDRTVGVTHLRVLTG